MPDFSTSLATCSSSSGVRGCRASVSLCTKNGMGTPQLRWRDTHQSGRFLIMASNRARPQDGKNCVSSTALFASSRSGLSSPCSMPMNHCGVARKMMGVLWRQQCG